MNDMPWYIKVQNQLRSIEEQNIFKIKDLVFINAEVKLLKFVIPTPTEDLPIDMSANQTGGLSTLCFLTEVDSLIGKDHLFKKSVIMMKAWCYYESRILGSHHGLISTYGSTVLLMYIFNAFYDQINTPLQVCDFAQQFNTLGADDFLACVQYVRL